MALVTQTFRTTVSAGGQIIDFSKAISNTGQLLIAETVADGQTDYVIACPLTIAKVVGISLYADGTCTVKTNSNSAPDETFALTATTPPVHWYTGALWVNPFGHNLLSLHVANASGAPVNVFFEATFDAS